MTDTASRDQDLIRKLTEIVHANLGNEAFGVHELAKASGMSLYRLSRVLHTINRKTVNQFIREVRLVRAHEMLLIEACTVSEAAYRTGFGSPAYFNKCFHEFYGYPPGKLKKGDQNSPEPVIQKDFRNIIRPGKISGNAGMINYARILFLILFVLTTVYFINGRVRPCEKKRLPAYADTRVSLVVMPF